MYSEVARKHQPRFMKTHEKVCNWALYWKEAVFSVSHERTLDVIDDLNISLL